MSPLVQGALIAVVPALILWTAQKVFEVKSRGYELRRYPREFLYEKQATFCAKAAKTLLEVSTLLGSAEVLLSENQKAELKGAERKLREKFGQLINAMDEMYVYMPEKVIFAGAELASWNLEHGALDSTKALEPYYKLIPPFLAALRECVGTEKISDELLTALAKKRGQPTESEP